MRTVVKTILILAALSAGLANCAEKPEAASKEDGGIISMAPHLTETIFALGKGDQVVAIGDFDDYPPEALALPKVGGYTNPNLERITRLQPSLIVLPGQHAEVTSYAKLHGIPVLNVHMDSFETIDAGIATLGKALGAETEAAGLLARMSNEKRRLREVLEGVQRPRVFIITMRQGHDLNTLYTVGGRSFVSELVELAGGENIYGDLDKDYIEASKETVVKGAPEAIIEFHSGQALTPEQEQDYIDDWAALPTLPAVKAQRIHLLKEAHGLRPGPRILEIARRIARLLHPEAPLPDD